MPSRSKIATLDGGQKRLNFTRELGSVQACPGCPGIILIVEFNDSTYNSSIEGYIVSYNLDTLDGLDDEYLMKWSLTDSTGRLTNHTYVEKECLR
jgi:hypothetical protein